MTDQEEIPRIPRSRLPWLFLALGLGVVLLVWASTGIWRSDPEEFTQDIIATYESCDGQEIRLLAAKHNLQLVFEPCGSNNFLHYQWSPTGVELYYQTNQGPWLLNADTFEHRMLPVGFPLGNAVWFTADVLAFPEHGVKTYNLDVFDVRKNVINITGLQQISPNTLTRGAGVDEVLFLAAEREPDPAVKDDDPPDKLYRMFANSGRVERAFPWLDEPVLDYTYDRHGDLLAYRVASFDGVIVARGDSGEEVRRFEGKQRVSVSTDGRFWVIEGPGAPIPVFNQRTEEDVEDGEATAAELDIPEYMPTEVEPPTLWVLDTGTDQLVALPDVFGYSFQWYEAQPYYASFVLWGMENKEFNRNVVLTDLTPQLRALGMTIDVEDLVPEPDDGDDEPASARFGS